MLKKVNIDGVIIEFYSIVFYGKYLEKNSALGDSITKANFSSGLKSVVHNNYVFSAYNGYCKNEQRTQSKPFQS